MREALEGYRRAAAAHGWKVRVDILNHEDGSLTSFHKIPESVERIASY